MFTCRVFSCVVGRGCLLWPVHSLGKTLLALPCFILYSKIKFACYSRYFLTSYFCIPGSYNEKDIFWGVLALEGLLGLHRTIQLQLLKHYLLGHRLGLLWYWIFCLGNEQRSVCCFWDCIQVLHFDLFRWLWWLVHFFQGILAHSSRYNLYWFISFLESLPFIYYTQILPKCQ